MLSGDTDRTRCLALRETTNRLNSSSSACYNLNIVSGTQSHFCMNDGRFWNDLIRYSTLACEMEGVMENFNGFEEICIYLGLWYFFVNLQKTCNYKQFFQFLLAYSIKRTETYLILHPPSSCPILHVDTLKGVCFFSIVYYHLLQGHFI